MDIDKKIHKIESKIKEPSFLENKGLSNEVGYYIFDYDPKYELKVRDDKAIINLLKLNSDKNLIVNYILERTPDNCVVFVTGVGKAYPILRSHNVLNNLHQKLDKVPVVLFFPGKYSGTDLILFNTVEGSNYYRAFPLIS